MTSALIQFLLQTVAIIVTTYLVPGMHITNFWAAIVTGLVISFINFFIKPFLQFISLPITVLTLGLFYLVINAVLLLLADTIVPGFKIDSFWWALLAAIVFSLVMMLLNFIFNQD